MSANAPGRDRTTVKDLMRSVRALLGRAVTPVEAPPAPEVDEALLRLVPADADLVELFAARAAESGAEVHRTLPDDLGATLEQLLRSIGASDADLGVRDPGLIDRVHDAVRAAGVSIVDDPHAQFDVDAGVTDVDAAIAETGTLVIESCPERSRRAHLAPPVHVAVVDACRIVADMVDYWPGLRRDGAVEMPAVSVLVSGPSKTADIEGILVTGVHGPGTVHVVIVE